MSFKSQHRNPGLRDAATALAELSTHEAGPPLFDLLRRLYVAADAGAESNAPQMPEVAQRGQPRPVGIWEPGPNGSFVRSRGGRARASLWASTPVIYPRSNRKRVVLLGESVARGFFFDPHYSPAQALQHLLRTAGGSADLEVIDLARTDLLLRPLLELAAAALQLKPDVMVVLAGNNWQPTLDLTPGQFADTANEARAGGWGTVKTYLEEELRQRVREAARALGALAAEHRFKLVVVVPEFNLADWSTLGGTPPLLSSEATEQWLATRKAAEAALASGDLQTARELGTRLTAMDHGTSAAGFNINAAASLQLGDLSQARHFREQARNTAICLPCGPDTPRCYSVVQEALREEAARNTFSLVDLPQVFQDRFPDELPGRRLFLDYCHFTREGTHLAMAAVARTVLASVFGLQRSVRELERIAQPIAPEVEAEAHFLAAIHNANWGQPHAIVAHHCATAVRLSGSIDRLMSGFVDFHVRRAPIALCRSFEQLCQSQSLSAVSLLFDPERPTAGGFLNIKLAQAILTALEDRQPQLRAKTLQLLQQENGVEGGEIDLLEGRFSAESFLTPVDQTRYAYYRAHDRSSSFRVISQPRCQIDLRLTYRTRGSSEAVAVTIDGVQIATLPASESWVTVNIVVPPEQVGAGVKVLEILWPAPSWNLAAWQGNVAASLEVGELRDVRPVFGEVQRLRASCQTLATTAGM